MQKIVIFQIFDTGVKKYFANALGKIVIFIKNI